MKKVCTLKLFPSGGMYWRLKFRINGKENVFSIGTYPDIHLSSMLVWKETRLDYFSSMGINPNEAKKEAATRNR